MYIKKILSLLLISLLMVSCSPQVPTPTGDTLNKIQVKELMHSGGFTAYNELIYDAEYAFPNIEWIQQEFYPKYWEFLKTQNLWVYVEQSHDCDDFAGEARLFAQKLNNQTENKGKRALAFGELHYTTDEGVGHAINFALIKSAEGNFKILFFEPQTGESVILSEKEKASIEGWIL